MKFVSMRSTDDFSFDPICNARLLDYEGCPGLPARRFNKLLVCSPKCYRWCKERMRTHGYKENPDVNR